MPAEDSGAANGVPHAVQRVIEFPKPPIFDVAVKKQVRPAILALMGAVIFLLLMKKS